MKSFSYPATEAGLAPIFYFAQVAVDVVDVWLRYIDGPRVRSKIASIQNCRGANPSLQLHVPVGVSEVDLIIQIIKRRQHLQLYVELEKMTPEVPS